MTVEHAAVLPGDATHVEWSVTNVGNTPASGSWEDQLYLDSGYGQALVPVLTHGYLTSIPPGESLELRRQIGVPADASLGNYSVVVKTDWRNDLAESDGTDNSRTSEPFLVTLPNLVVSEMSATETSSPFGLTYRVEWTVKNISTDIRALGTWYDTVALKSSHPFFEERELLRYGYFTSIPPGEEIEFSRNVYIPEDIWTGTYCLEVRTDIRHEQRELHESDNDRQVCGIELSGEAAPAIPIHGVTILVLCTSLLAAAVIQMRRIVCAARSEARPRNE